jgi:hypothetical protein
LIALVELGVGWFSLDFLGSLDRLRCPVLLAPIRAAAMLEIIALGVLGAGLLRRGLPAHADVLQR